MDGVETRSCSIVSGSEEGTEGASRHECRLIGRIGAFQVDESIHIICKSAEVRRTQAQPRCGV